MKTSKPSFQEYDCDANLAITLIIIIIIMVPSNYILMNITLRIEGDIIYILYAKYI